jgi:hypothetical protein
MTIINDATSWNITHESYADRIIENNYSTHEYPHMVIVMCL